MSRYPGRALRAGAVAAALVCAYGAGLATAGDGDRAAGQAASRSPLDEAAASIAERSADRVTRAELTDAAVAAMLRTLDDRWARHYTARQFDDVTGRLDGRYSGVGVWLGAAGGARVRIASVQPGSAAARAGVRAGDVVVAAGGAPAGDLAAVAAALRGTPGGAVALTVEREGRRLDFRLVRTALRDGDVTVTDLPDHVRMIRVGAFTRGVGRDVRAAVTGDPAAVRGGIVLDLRGDPGGLLAEAVATASAFLPGGLVVTFEQRDRPPRPLTVTEPGDARTPLVVLVDSGTASAAEIVAGALRDRDRAVIVGSRTYGKGSVQEAYRLSDSSAIELTVGRYRTPSGRNLDGTGIEPDVTVSADRPPTEAEQRARTVLRGLLVTLPKKDRG
ncbi:putative CtpA-like serine protease [Actinomadura rubteroloni]|uniref:Putative CtpA-like serine protease n=1 Tax=Actinomadura rubteroloni TaxID=1926885 RepID=A0A2P4UPV0_9ACTN|nr:S41 family peptidase [Actinomadura rubteroloni]POM27073.1 putative CtpA-like serine protease [Actinomadura rubteroloni]